MQYEKGKNKSFTHGQRSADGKSAKRPQSEGGHAQSSSARSHCGLVRSCGARIQCAGRRSAAVPIAPSSWRGSPGNAHSSLPVRTPTSRRAHRTTSDRTSDRLTSIASASTAQARKQSPIVTARNTLVCAFVRQHGAVRHEANGLEIGADVASVDTMLYSQACNQECRV